MGETTNKSSWEAVSGCEDLRTAMGLASLCTRESWVRWETEPHRRVLCWGREKSYAQKARGFLREEPWDARRRESEMKVWRAERERKENDLQDDWKLENASRLGES